jgi:hypothetical protein
MKTIKKTRTYKMVIQIDPEDYHLLSGQHYYVHGKRHRALFLYAIFFEPKRTKKSLARLIMKPKKGQQVFSRRKIIWDATTQTYHIDLRKSNLFVSKYNHYCRRKSPRKSSRYKGVSWCKRERIWHANYSMDGNKYCLGRYESEIAAAKAYDEAIANTGREAVFNFPQTTKFRGKTKIRQKGRQ